jgi:hypothetical protein
LYLAERSGQIQPSGFDKSRQRFGPPQAPLDPMGPAGVETREAIAFRVYPCAGLLAVDQSPHGTF